MEYEWEVMERFGVKQFYLLIVRDEPTREQEQTAQTRGIHHSTSYPNPSKWYTIFFFSCGSVSVGLYGSDTLFYCCVGRKLKGEQAIDDSCWGVQSGAAPLNWRMNRREMRREDELRGAEEWCAIHQVSYSGLKDESIVILIGSSVCVDVYEKKTKYWWLVAVLSSQHSSREGPESIDV